MAKESNNPAPPVATRSRWLQLRLAWAEGPSDGGVIPPNRHKESNIVSASMAVASAMMFA